MSRLFSSSLSFRLGLTVVIGALLIVAAVFYTFNKLQKQMAEDLAVRQSEAVVAQMLATREVYTKNVIGKLHATGIVPSFHRDLRA